MEEQFHGGSQFVAVLSFALESNAFNPEPRRLSDFQILEEHEYASNIRQAGFVDRLRAVAPGIFSDVEVCFLCLYRGFCGGLIPVDDFGMMVSHAVKLLRKRPYCAAYVDLHGAMCVAGRGAAGDAEAELVEAIRGALPPRALIAASFDLHANFSPRLGLALDFVAAYKTVPHIDMEETKTKALRMLLDHLQRRRHTQIETTAVVVVKVPAILSGDTVLTTEGPGVELYNSLTSLEQSDPAVFDASLFVGHQHANEARVGAAVVLTGEASAAPELSRHAQHIAQRFWDARKEFDYSSSCKLIEWCEATVAMCADGGERLLIGDFGDNVTAGAPGDLPFVLRALLEQTIEQQNQKSVLLAGLVDREALERCKSVGEGAEIYGLIVGGMTNSKAHYHAGCEPLTLTKVNVVAIINDGRWAVFRVRHVTVVLQDCAWAFFNEWDIQRLPETLRPNRFDVTVMKLGMNIEDVARAAQGDSACCFKCLLVNTPGACHEPLPERCHLPPQMFPVDLAVEWTAPLGQWRVRGD